MVRVFQWNDDLWYGTAAGKKVAGPHSSMGAVVNECERKGRRKVKVGPPPPSWFKGTAGPDKAPEPFKKALTVAANVASTVAKVAAVALDVVNVAEILELSIPKLTERIKKFDGKDALKVLNVLYGMEFRGRNRKGAMEVIDVRRRKLRRAAKK